MDDAERRRKFEEMFGSKKFDVESSINMYANSFVVLPAFALYEDDILDKLKESTENCHIYFIGLVPKVDFVDCSHINDELITSFKVEGKQYDLNWPMPPSCKLQGDGESGWFILRPDGAKIFPSEKAMMARVNQSAKITFKVLYIGQAYGENGSRNAIDRLKKHETLQKISLKGIPEGYVLTLLLFEILPANRMIMMLNPFAQDSSNGDERIEKSIEKLRGTTEAEKTTLYEAAMIKYFSPPFNKEFKNSFPSTNLKLLADCYEKDIAGVTAEIVFDEMPFSIYSDTVSASTSHIAHHDLHKEEDRRVFFTGASRS